MDNNKATMKLLNIGLLNLTLNKPEKNLPDDMAFNYNLNLTHQVSLENNIINVIASIDIMHQDKETKLGFIKTSCAYKIERLNEYVGEESSKINLPSDILTTLNAATISTTRGIMFSQFKGTFLHKAQLPLVDPAGFKQT